MKTIRKSTQEYVRGVIGGFLFSLPILFTMEVWWMGFTMSPVTQLLYLLGTFALLLGYNRYAGLRANASWAEVAIDSVEELGIGLVLSAVFLWVIGVLDLHNISIDRLTSMIVVEAMAVAIGVSVGTAQLGDSGADEDSGMTSLDLADADDVASTLTERAVIALCAAVLFAANIAPTEEVKLLAVMLNPVKALLLVLLSLLFGVLILYYTEFKGSRVLYARDELSVRQVLTDTMMSYCIALISSAISLWLFGQFDKGGFEIGVYQIIVLGVAANLGATAGRLLLK